MKDFGIRGFDLAYALMDSPELTILVDACSRGVEPGTAPDIDAAPEAISDLSLRDPLHSSQRVAPCTRSM